MKVASNLRSESQEETFGPNFSIQQNILQKERQKGDILDGWRLRSSVASTPALQEMLKWLNWKIIITDANNRNEKH